MAEKKILFLVAHRPGRSPGQRFRFEQYLSHLEANGFRYQISYLISEKDDAAFYAPGKFLAKTRIVLKSIRQRLRDIKTAHDFDLVFIYREAHMLWFTWFETQLKRLGAKIILDFDDSIWLNDTSDGNRQLAWLKRPSKTSEILRLCDMALVGNAFLADYASRFNRNVHIVPTTIDTSYYLPDKKLKGEAVCIGWTGSSTTLKHLQEALPVLQELRRKYGEKVTFRVISNKPFKADLPGLENLSWNRETEVSDLYPVDIGIMPLPDDEWARGKCGFKGLQYMALEIPAVMSPVGVNTEIITDGVNGFLASNNQEWIDKLSLLIESAELRQRLGKAGRQTVVERYSFDSQKDRYLQLFNSLCER
ncbi:MAG: glycosyltransferase family 4 protein [Bacteroides sp.]|jgi:glycosyltransferase involved in cell wall biosynthesis|nr:glycosyltransferase family 4 protein [Bacteroides sp.]